MKTKIKHVAGISLFLLSFVLPRLDAQAQYCSGTTNLTASSGNFSDGSGTNNYMNNTSCSWLIQPSPAASSITLSFSAFQLESCCDYVRVYDGSTTSDPLLGSFNGSSLPPSLTSSGGSMYVTFTTDGSVTYQGWDASYTSVAACTAATPTITASGPTTFCAGGSVTLTSSSASTYLWSNGATTQSIAVSQSGDYTVSITDASGCGATSAPVTVTNNGPTVAASANPTSVCAGGTTQLNATAGTALQENFDPTTTSQWSSITGTESTSCGSVSGNALYFSNAGTREAVTQNLNVSGGGSISFYLKIAYASSSPCEQADTGEDVLLQYSTDGGSTWTTINTYATGATYQNFTLINTTIPAAAQTASTKFKWTQPSHSGSGFDNWAIDDMTITGSGSGSYSYSWSPTTGLSNATIANPTATVSANTTYTVTVTDNGSGCTNSASVAVSTFTPPTATITASGSTTICQGDSVLLSANTGIAYLWSTGDTMQNIYASQSGNYTVTVTYAGGCTSTSAATTVTVNTAATPTITASGATTFCAGGSVTLTSSTATSYLWSNGATTQSITVSQSGTYTVTITNSSGCTASSAPTTVTNNGPSVWASADPASVCTGGTTQLYASAGSALQEDFDPINNSQWVSTTGATVSNTCGSVSGNALYFNGSATRNAETQNLNVSGGGTVSFYLKIAYNATTGCETADPGDEVLLQYSTNSGSTWTTINTYYTGVTYQDFTLVNVTIPTGAQTSATRFKWVQPVHAGIDFDNWMIDDVSITGSGSGSYSYSWSPTTGVSDPTIANPTAVVSANTTYTVTVTDNGSGCTNSASVTVTTFTPPTATITASGTTTFCQGSSVLLTANSGIAYLWSTGDTTQSINASQSGNYTVTVTYAGGCTSTSAATTVTATTTGAAPASCIINTTSYCCGIGIYNVTLNTINNTTADGIEGYQNYACNQQTTLTAGQSYTISVTTGPSYQEDVSVWIDYDNDGTFDPATELAFESLVVMGTHSGSFVPSGTALLNTPLRMRVASDYYTSILAPCTDVTYGQAEDYTVTIQPTCSAATPTVTVSGPTSFCTGGSVTLTSSAANSYLWSNGATTQSITVSQSGNYFVNITDASGCNASSAPIAVTVYTSPFADITANGPVTFCEGGSVTLTANQATSYLWSNGAITQSITVNTSDNYVVTVTDPSGCAGTASDSLSVTVNPLPATPTITKSGDVFTSSSATGNQWYFNGSLITGATGQTYTSSTAGTYGVTVTDANGCTSPMGTLNTTGLEEKQFDESTFKAYPNPFSNETTISYTLNGKSAVTLEVFNILGEKIAVMANEEQAAGEHTYKLSTYATGIYVVHLRAGNHTYTQKVVSVR